MLKEEMKKRVVINRLHEELFIKQFKVKKIGHELYLIFDDYIDSQAPKIHILLRS